MSLLRRSPLTSSGKWNRSAPRKDSPKRSMYEARILAAKAAKARDKALTGGCEFRTFLRGWYAINGCAACHRHDRTGPHLHHTAHRSRKGRAETQVPICPSCHTEDNRGIERKAMEDHGADLYQIAGELAVAGTHQGYLPVEVCDQCGAWHSKRFLIDDVDQSTGIVRRLCEECAPEGPI